MTSHSLPLITRPLGLVMPLAHAERVNRISAVLLRALRAHARHAGGLRSARFPCAHIVHVALAARLGDALAVVFRALHSPRAARVGLLLHASCPPDIAGPVAGIVVDSVDRVQRPTTRVGAFRPRTDARLDVLDECRQVTPWRVDADAPAAVARVVGRRRIVAASQYAGPGLIQGVPVLSRGESVPTDRRQPSRFPLGSAPMNGRPEGAEFAAKSCRAGSSRWRPGGDLRRRVVARLAARLVLAGDQAGDCDRRFGSAVTATYGTAPSLRLCRLNANARIRTGHDQASESLAHFYEQRRPWSVPRSLHEPSIATYGVSNLFAAVSN